MSTDIMDMEEENRENDKSKVRVFVGGLGEGVTSDDLRRMFGSLGAVDGVDIIRTKGRRFAYVDFIPSPTDQNSLSKLFSRYSGCLWKGGKLKLEKAKEHYLVRLKREWEEDAKLASDEPGTSPDPDESISSKDMPSKDSLKTKKLRIFFPKLRKVKSIPFTGTGKHKYSFPKVEVPPLPVHFCDCEEHSSPTGTIRPKQFHDGEAESGGMDDEEINIMNVVMNKLFGREKMSSPMHFEKEQNLNVSPGGSHSDESEADSATDDDDDDGLIINMETKKKKTDIIGSLELERILRNQESELNKTKILKNEQLEVQKSNNITPDKKRKPRENFQRKRNDSTSAISEDKRHMHKHPDEMSSQAHITELGGFREPTKASWSQKSSWKELLGNGGSSCFSASHMLLDSKSTENQGSDGFCEPELAKNKSEHVVMEGVQEIEPAEAEVTEKLAEAQPTIQNVTSKESGRGVAWKQKQSWTQLVGQNNNSFSIYQIFPGISSEKPVAKEPAEEDLGGSSDGKYIDLAKESTNESVGDGLNLAKNSPEKKHNVLAKHTTVESVGDGLNMTRRTPEKSQHVAGKVIAPAPITEGNCDTLTNETSTTEVKIGETCSFMRSAASLKEWAKTKAALSGSLKRKRGEKKKEH